MGVLAINGGEPLCKASFFRWPYATESDANVLEEVKKSGYYGSFGIQSRTFSERFAALNGAKYCIPVSNGTQSLELIMRGLGIGVGDEVIIQGYTFIATLSSIIYVGATPVFCDIDLDTYSMSVESVRKKITPRTKAIIPVYVSGRPADLDALVELAEEKGIYLIGDAAQAVGAEWRGRGIGSYGIAASFSFQNTKNLTCGEGGAITTNSNELYYNIMNMLNMGKDKDGKYSFLGVDYNISEWQAGILNTQLDKFPEQLEKRNENARILDEYLSEFDFVSPLKEDPRITKNAYHFYTFRVHEEKLKGVTRDQFLNALNHEGVPVVMGYTPLYHTNVVKSEYTKKQIQGKIKVDLKDYPNTEYAYKHESAWIYSSDHILLSEPSDIKLIADSFKKVYDNIEELL